MSNAGLIGTIDGFNRIFLTGSGRAILTRMVDVAGRLGSRIFGGLSPEQLTNCEEALAHIRHNLRSELASRKIGP